MAVTTIPASPPQAPPVGNTGPASHKLDRWVVRRVFLFGLLGGLAGFALLKVKMVGDPGVFAEIWSTGIVISPQSRVDIVDWARPRARGDDAAFSGMDLGTQPLARVLHELTGDSLTGDHAVATGGTVRSLAMEGGCQVRIGWTPDNQLEFRIQPIAGDAAAQTCTVSGEVEPPVAAAAVNDEWGDVPGASLTFTRPLRPADRALLRFSPEASYLPLRIGRFAIRGAGFVSDNRDDGASMIHGGVMRLPDFMSDGEEQVFVLDRMVGRGHPIHPGDQIRFGDLKDGEMVQLEIGELIHAQIIGKASAPHIAAKSLEPSVLQQLNDQYAMLWVFAFALGALGVTATVIEAAR